MSEATSNVGKFVWYEYMGDDLDAATTFYGAVVGWSFGDPGMAGFPYKIAAAGDYPVGGMMNIPDDAKAMGAPPCWTGYVYVDDIDAAAAKLTAAGGSVKKGPWEIPHVGRMAIVADPHGAYFALFRDLAGMPPAAPAPGTPGLVGWRELHAADGDAAFAFYADQFGWKKLRDLDMGPIGTYRIFESGVGESGGMMTRMPQTPGPFWLYYFNVDSVDAAVERVKAAGGQIAHGPNQVPTGQWVVQCIDPRGAFFALVAPHR